MMRWLLLLALVFVASPALGQAWTGNCDGTGVAITQIGAPPDCPSCKRNACFNMEAKGTIDSLPLTVVAPSVLFCLDAADDDADADSAAVWIHKCLGPNTTASDAQCILTTDAVVTGAAGGSSTQNACYRYGPGVYFIEITNDGDAGDNPFVSAEVEGG